MIKLILSIVALVLIGLSLYVYMDKESTPSTQPAAHKAVAVEQPSIKDEPTKTASVKKVEQVAQAKATQKSVPAEKPSVASSSSEDTAQAEAEIGKGLTLESIENADVSDEEKERMKMDIAYRKIKHAEKRSVMTREELMDLFRNDVKNGLISK